MCICIFVLLPIKRLAKHNFCTSRGRKQEGRWVTEDGRGRLRLSIRSACTTCSEISSLCTEHFQPYSLLLLPSQEQESQQAHRGRVLFPGCTSKITAVFKLQGTLCNGQIFAYSFPLQGKALTDRRLISLGWIYLQYLRSTSLIPYEQTARGAISLWGSFIVCRN